jgi:hypothetical protein
MAQSMRFTGMVAFAASLLAFGSTEHAAHANPPDPIVQWEGSSAVMAGTGCLKDVDAFVRAEGAGLSVVMKNMGVQLGAQSSTADRLLCTIRVNLEVPAGMFPARVHQTLAHPLVKSAGASVTLDARPTFYAWSPGAFTSSFPVGQAEQSSLVSRDHLDTTTRDAAAPGYQAFCGHSRPTTGFFTANIDVSGALQSSQDYVSTLDSENATGLRYDVTVELEPC